MFNSTNPTESSVKGIMVIEPDEENPIGSPSSSSSQVSGPVHKDKGNTGALSEYGGVSGLL